ncbi:hypothetical protein SO802_018745 [Lithocarpus litseifolius]|uniref:RNase H type-1 domain-containing protein n=1 Tax=Lithocarpus litseifolius TaxID=425828 RepID=A0AAW2CNM1_9ROSI
MWQLKIPAKIRVFAWRACMNGLPTRLSLENKGVRIKGSCPLCEKGPESIKHALVHCSKAWEVWWSWQTCPINFGEGNLDVTDIAMQIMEKGSAMDLEIFFITTWSIWYNRNQVVHEQPYLTPSQVWDNAQRLRCDYKGAITANFLRQQPPVVGWAAPPPDTFKINVDGATTVDGKRSSVGVVIRECRGIMVAARSVVLNACYDVETTEALAIEAGILLAGELKLHKVIIELDSLIAVQAVNSGSCHGTMGPVIHGALNLLNQFGSWKIQHLKRDYNKVAQELAQYARRTDLSQTWMGNEPPWLHNLLLFDRSKC